MTTTTLPIDFDNTRRWSVGDHCGDTFGEGSDYDGSAVVIELRTPEEAKAVAQAILDHIHEE